MNIEDLLMPVGIMNPDTGLKAAGCGKKESSYTMPECMGPFRIQEAECCNEANGS